jgi:hypothetical protein
MLECPNCHKQFNEGRRPVTDSIHHERECELCGVLLLWDEPVKRVSGQIISGPPEQCTHKNRVRPGAMVPIPK